MGDGREEGWMRSEWGRVSMRVGVWSTIYRRVRSFIIVCVSHHTHLLPPPPPQTLHLTLIPLGDTLIYAQYSSTYTAIWLARQPITTRPSREEVLNFFRPRNGVGWYDMIRSVFASMHWWR